MIRLWATRGHTWGFRFLIRPQGADPLPEYEQAFAGLEDDAEACRRTGRLLALRLPDPEQRTDHAGRRIPHDFVLTGDLASRVRTVADGYALVWPLVAEEYAKAWDADRPPAARG